MVLLQQTLLLYSTVLIENLRNQGVSEGIGFSIVSFFFDHVENAEFAKRSSRFTIGGRAADGIFNYESVQFEHAGVRIREQDAPSTGEHQQ